MTDLRTAAQQALEALKSCSGVPHWPALQPTITALRAALEQPEPVNYFEVQRIANERGLDYNKFAAALRDYAALKKRNA
jgi:hypothetical protein